jgi:multidrug efflux pump subunit AcrB
VFSAVAFCHWVIDRFVLEPIFLRPMNWLMEHLTAWYAVILRVTLRHKWFVVPMSVLLAALALLFVYGVNIKLPSALTGQTERRVQLKPVGQELVPGEDQSRFVVNVICPVGSNIEHVSEMLAKTEKVMAELEDPKTKQPVVATMFAAVAIRPGQLVSEGICFVRLVPISERSWSQSEIIAETRKRLAQIPGMRAVALDLSTQGFTPTRGYPINFAVQGPEWEMVTVLSERIKERMIDSRVVTDVNSDYRPGMPEVHVIPDREKASQLGIPIQKLAWAVNVAFGGVRNGRFTDKDKRYDVRVRLLEQQRQIPQQLGSVYIKTAKGQLVPLSDLTQTKMIATNPQINRYNHLRKVELTANVAPGSTQGEAFNRCLEIADEEREKMDLPPSYRIVPMGNAQAMSQTLNSMWAALGLGFIVAYMILGVQFNSFVHPLTVLLAVPFGVTGALGVLWVCGDTLNLMSMIGMVLLAGLVKKNSIILVDYTNQLRAQGKGLEEAVLEACPVRLRPIIMTSLACIASAIPLAMGYGPGAETRAPLARSIIGGMFLSTLVTLIIVPVFYIEFDKFGSFIMRLAKREPKQQTMMPEPEVVIQIPEPAVNGESKKPEKEPVLPLEVRPEAAT